jgi:hypothetical protein
LLIFIGRDSVAVSSRYSQSGGIGFLFSVAMNLFGSHSPCNIFGVGEFEPVSTCFDLGKELLEAACQSFAVFSVVCYTFTRATYVRVRVDFHSMKTGA